MPTRSSAIYGVRGTQVNAEERAFFEDNQPLGFILFARNIVDAQQTTDLCAELDACVHGRTMILIDEEGGTVTRLPSPPFRRTFDPALLAEMLTEREDDAVRAAYLNARLTADDLKPMGVNVNCAPMLDVVQADAHAFLQKRRLGRTSRDVVTLGRAIIEGLKAGGVAPVLKHIPGHGRGSADTHFDLPTVSASLRELEETDFAPFRALASEAMAMTGHLVFAAIDAERCATVSPATVEAIRTKIGFDGLLMTDDLNMKALGGTLQQRGRDSLAAGCDVLLHCNGEFADMKAVAEAAVPLGGRAEARAQTALDAAHGSADALDRQAAEAELASLVAPLA